MLSIKDGLITFSWDRITIILACGVSLEKRQTDQERRETAVCASYRPVRVEQNVISSECYIYLWHTIHNVAMIFSELVLTLIFPKDHTSDEWQWTLPDQSRCFHRPCCKSKRTTKDTNWKQQIRLQLKTPRERMDENRAWTSHESPFSDNLFDVLLNAVVGFSLVHWMICVCNRI